MTYARSWYGAEAAAGSRSAEHVLRVVLPLVTPKSAVDVGSGVGPWAATLLRLGVQDVLAVDGSDVPIDMLQVSPDQFIVRDLAKPLELGRSFDLAIALEVAEHLPAPSAPIFVESLVRLAPFVLFSAALPGQGGTHHLNERWPDEWAALFAAHGYVPVDCIRPALWDDDDVSYYYRQNTILYVRGDRASIGSLRDVPDVLRGPPRRLVHPVLYADALRRLPPTRFATLAQAFRFLALVVSWPMRRRIGVWTSEERRIRDPIR